MPDNLLLSLILVLLCGFMGGEISRRIGAPPLLGMMLVGIFLGTSGSNLITGTILDLADDLRSIAVTIILMRAGLGLDRDKLAKQGSVAIRLGFLPALTEAISISLLAIWLLKFNWLTGLLLGCVISAESPAVIVPGMLRLKSLGWGVSKGIADAILTGSALSDVLILLLFSLLLNFLSPEALANNNYDLWLLPIKAIAQIVLGIIVGYLTAKIIVFCTINRKWTQNSVQDTLVTTSLSLLIVNLSSYFPYFSGYLGVMAMGFFIVKFSPPLARRLRQKFNHLWIVAEIVLFVLMGATIQLQILEDIFLPGLILLTLGLLLGRTIGWYLATVGSNWTWKEKLFLLPGNSAKATVQAAIGAIPLSLGIPQGDIILAIAALSILVTAPLGAWAIPTFAPKLLTQDKVDPTQNSHTRKTIIMGAIDGDTELAIPVLTTVADLSRRTNGEAVIIYHAPNSEPYLSELERLTNKLLLDIPFKSITIIENLEEEMLIIAQQYGVTEIVMACRQEIFRDNPRYPLTLDVVASNSSIPLILLTINDK